MKKVYILFGALVFSWSAVAQPANQMFTEENAVIINSSSELTAISDVITPISSSTIVSTNLIWSSDFSNPSDWVLDNNGQNPPDYGWSIDQTSDGWWSSNGISSTSGGNFAELSNGNPQLTPSTQVGGVVYTMTTAQPINIFDSIASGNATLSFEEYGARFYDLQEVQVSTDGINFTTVGDNLGYTMLTQNSGNVAYPNPTIREINISPYIGSTPTTVWVRFSWTSALNLAITDQYYYNTWITYGWYIDDVQISESPANRVTMEDEVIGGYWIDYLNYTASGPNYMIGLDYSVTPLSQLQNHPYAIEAVLRNEGTSSQDVTLNYDVTGTATSSGVSSITTLAPGDSTIPSTTFSPTVIGNYSIDIYGTADSAGYGTTITTTDIVSKDIEVSNYIYGKDLGGNNPGSYVLGGPLDQNHITSRFEMYENEQLTSARVFISDISVVGAVIKAIIYELDTAAANGVVPLAESDNYILTAQDRGAWIDIPFVSPISLYSGYAYEFGIVGYQHPTDSSYIGLSGSSMYNGEHSLYDELGLSTQSSGTPTWYYITSTPMVRMNFTPPASIVENTFNGNLIVYPNPSKGSFILELSAVEDDNYSIVVTDILGKDIFVKTVDVKDFIKETIDLSSYSKGAYMLEITNSFSTISKKLIIE